MKRIRAYLGVMFAVCLSYFESGVSALAEPLAFAYRAAKVLPELAGAGLKRLQITLAMWGTGSSVDGSPLKSNLRASSNHFEMQTCQPCKPWISVGTLSC